MECFLKALTCNGSFWNQYLFLLGDGRVFFVGGKRAFVGILRQYIVVSAFEHKVLVKDSAANRKTLMVTVLTLHSS